MSDKSSAIAELDAARDRFRALIAGLPDEKYDETWLGSWNLSHLLAHMSGWFDEMTLAIERVGRGEKPTPDGVDFSDSDAWNAKFAAEPKPGEAALADWDAAYTRYRDAAASLDEGKFGTDPASGKPRIGRRLLQGAGIGHFEEHQPELEAWLAGA